MAVTRYLVIRRFGSNSEENSAANAKSDMTTLSRHTLFCNGDKKKSAANVLKHGVRQ